MPTRTVGWALALAACVLAGSGCASRYAPLVRTHTASAMQCDAESLTATHLGEERWAVSGCGAQAVFRCRYVAWLGLRCVGGGVVASAR